MQIETIQRKKIRPQYYFRCPCILIYNHKPVPLKNIKYDVAINGGLANVTLSQEYVNNESTAINVTYKFPISDKVVFSGIQAIFKGRRVSGEIKEKKAAKMEFEHRKAKGDVVAYAEQLEETEDIMKLELGNFPAGESLTICFSYLMRLDVINEVNWGFRIPSTLTPRYNPGTGESTPQPIGQKRMKKCKPMNPHYLPPTNIMTVAQKYSWEINVVINWPGDSNEIKCTTHSDNIVLKRMGSVMKASFGSKVEYPDKDFEIIFQDKQLFSNQCSVAVCDLPTIKGNSPKYAAIMQFVPSMYKWYYKKGLKQEKGVDFYEDENTFFLLENTLAEFIFVLDRSGSMSGTRIEKAKKSLIFFIKSLPPNSRFNIISFGSSFKSMFPTSVVYSSQTAQQAISQISNISADMGGTNILGPINSAFYYPSVQNYQRNIFLLTDGSVSNAHQVIQSIESHCINNKARVFSIGIGNGTSEMLVHRSAKVGGGRSVIISDSENVEAKIIGLLNDSLTPSLTNFKVEFDKKYIAALAPMLDSESHITRGEPFVMYALLKNDIENSENLSTQVKVSFFDSVTKKMEERVFNISLDGCLTDNSYHKMCVKHLIDAKKTVKNNVYIENALASKSDIYEKLAVGYQVLSAELTAFICVIEENKDGNYMQTKDVIVPNIESIDYTQGQNQQIQQFASCSQVGGLSTMFGCFGPQYGNNMKKCRSRAMNNCAKPTANRRSGMKKKCKSKERGRNKMAPQKKMLESLKMEEGCEIYFGGKALPMQERKNDILNKGNISNGSGPSSIAFVQEFDGSWKYSADLLSKIGLNEDIVSAFRTKIGNDDLFMTLLIITWMLKYAKSKEFDIIIKKGKMYLMKNKVEDTLKEECKEIF